jgi:hypothetical protein
MPWGFGRALLKNKHIHSGSEGQITTKIKISIYLLLVHIFDVANALFLKISIQGTRNKHQELVEQVPEQRNNCIMNNKHDFKFLLSFRNRV